MRVKIHLALCLWLGAAVSLSAQNLLSNGDFEAGVAKAWGAFIPGESKEKGCTLSDAAGRVGKGAKLQAAQYARYGAANGIKISSNGGERFRLSIWVKATSNAEPQPQTAGIVFRCIFSDVAGKDVTTAIGTLDGKVYKNGDKVEKANLPLPKDWTKMQMVLDSPANATTLNFTLFAWRAKGEILIDEASVEKVGKEVPLSLFQ